MNQLRRILVLLWIGVVPVFAREPTSQDYDVWNAIIVQWVSASTVYVWHLVEPTAVFDRGTTKGALESFPEVRPVQRRWSTPAAELDVDKFRFAGQRAIPLLGAPPTVKLLDAATLKKVAGRTPKSAWLMSPRLLPDTGAIFRMSWPAYREDGRAAYVICAVCSEYWGSVTTCKVDKDFLSGKWRPGEAGRRDFTHWQDGELFIDDWP